jgi:hypothetical protein
MHKGVECTGLIVLVMLASSLARTTDPMRTGSCWLGSRYRSRSRPRAAPASVGKQASQENAAVLCCCYALAMGWHGTAWDTGIEHHVRRQRAWSLPVLVFVLAVLVSGRRETRARRARQGHRITVAEAQVRLRHLESCKIPCFALALLRQPAAADAAEQS